MAVVSNMFVDDMELANSLTLSGFKATPSDIEFIRSDISQKWRWSFDGASWSTLEILRGSGTADRTVEVARLASWNGTKLTVLDLAWMHSIPQVPAMATVGELASGTLFGGAEAKTFAGYGDANVHGSATGKIQFQGDPSCDGFSP